MLLQALECVPEEQESHRGFPGDHVLPMPAVPTMGTRPGSSRGAGHHEEVGEGRCELDTGMAGALDAQCPLTAALGLEESPEGLPQRACSHQPRSTEPAVTPPDLQPMACQKSHPCLSQCLAQFCPWRPLGSQRGAVPTPAEGSWWQGSGLLDPQLRGAQHGGVRGTQGACLYSPKTPQSSTAALG